MEFEVSYSLDNEQQFWDGKLVSFSFTIGFAPHPRKYSPRMGLFMIPRAFLALSLAISMETSPIRVCSSKEQGTRHYLISIFYSKTNTVPTANLICPSMRLELEEIVSAPCDSHATIDNVLRSYLGLVTKYKGVLVNRSLRGEGLGAAVCMWMFGLGWHGSRSPYVSFSHLWIWC